MPSALVDWIRRHAIPFSHEAPESVNAAVDKVIAALGNRIQLLAFGEALHGGEDILILRNRLFQRLVQAHGYTAIAIESSFPRGILVNDYIAGRIAREQGGYDAMKDRGFSHGFGQLDANRELIEWMRQYNADPSQSAKLHFYGFDSPSEMTGTDSPRQLLNFVLDYLDSINPVSARAGADERRERIDSHLGQDSDWENPAAIMDPTKSVGLSPAATALRIETEELITELHLRRPELATTDSQAKGLYLEAAQHALIARQLLNYHASLARQSTHRIVELLGIRDLIIADNLNYTVTREHSRDHAPGKVFAFGHNSHLQRAKARWQLGPNLLEWSPAGAHLAEMLGSRYAVIATAIGQSKENGIAPPEPNSLEAHLTASAGPMRFIPTQRALDPRERIAEIADLSTRTGSTRNSTYMPLIPQTLNDLDWLAVLDSTTYTRGGPPLPG
jgi:erythromycin esterase